MLLDLGYGNLPSLHGVALLATCAELALVDIGVTIGALVTHIRENRLRVALRAGHRCVHASEGKLGLVVVELRDVADRFPTGKGVAILAGDV